MQVNTLSQLPETWIHLDWNQNQDNAQYQDINAHVNSLSVANECMLRIILVCNIGTKHLICTLCHPNTYQSNMCNLEAAEINKPHTIRDM